MPAFLIFISLSFSWVLLRLLIPFLAQNFPDRPTSRSSHRLVKPRAGGVSFVFVTCLFVAISYLYPHSSPSHLSPINLVPLISLPLALVGLIDDFSALSSLTRYLFQAFTALFLVILSPLPFSFALYILIPLLITAIINFTNFVDGLDGLLASNMIVALSFLYFHLFLPNVILVLLGSLVAFLLWNWCPSKVFMGDVGSTFLGAVFAGVLLQSDSWLHSFSLLLIFTPLFGDSLSCLLRRLLKRQNIFKPHRLHLYQRLQQSGFSHSYVSILYTTFTLSLGLAYTFYGLPLLLILCIATIVFGFFLDEKFAAPFE